MEKQPAPSLRFIGTDDYLNFYSEFEQSHDIKSVHRNVFAKAMCNSISLKECFDAGGEEAAAARAWLLDVDNDAYSEMHKRLVNKHNSVKAALKKLGTPAEELTAELFPLPKKGTRATAGAGDIKSAWARRMKARRK